MKRKLDFRNIVQILFLVVSSIVIYLMRSGKNINPHSVCPYSGVCFGVPASAGLLDISPFLISAIVGGVILLSTMVFGRFFCGWVCPIGSIQEFVHAIGRKSSLKKTPSISNSLHKKMSYIKYVILLINVTMAYLLVQPLYMNLCPVLSLSNIGKPLIIAGATVSLLIISSIYVERFFCKYLCPFGALMNIMQMIGKVLRIPRFKIKVNEQLCTHCTLCTKNCPMQINVDALYIVEDGDCIQCNRCKTACPRDGITTNCKVGTKNEK